MHVSRELHSIGIEHVNEHPISGMIVDIVIASARIVIEVNGPWHYGFKSRRVLGPTLFKERMLRKLGWQLVPIAYFEWKALTDAQARQGYLRDRLPSV